VRARIDTAHPLDAPCNAVKNLTDDLRHAMLFSTLKAYGVLVYSLASLGRFILTGCTPGRTSKCKLCALALEGCRCAFTGETGANPGERPARIRAGRLLFNPAGSQVSHFPESLRRRFQRERAGCQMPRECSFTGVSWVAVERSGAVRPELLATLN